MNFEQHYQAYLTLVENALRSYMEQIEETSIVSQAMAYSLMNGGKRVRPVLALAFCDMLCGDAKKALPFACALEMIHSCSLIHDDLPCMDDDDMRRGKPSCHKQFGEAFALLAGDGLLTYAFEIAAAANVPAQTALRCISVLAQAAGIESMIAGQTMDLLSENQVISLEELQKLHALKTGKMITAPCLFGVICAEGNEADFENAKRFGEIIGLQFQILDDILDYTSTEEVLGKPIGSDAQNHKSTYVSLMGLERAQQQADALTEQALEILQGYGEKADFLIAFTQKLASRKK